MMKIGLDEYLNSPQRRSLRDPAGLTQAEFDAELQRRFGYKSQPIIADPLDGMTTRDLHEILPDYFKLTIGKVPQNRADPRAVELYRNWESLEHIATRAGVYPTSSDFLAAMASGYNIRLVPK